LKASGYARSLLRLEKPGCRVIRRLDYCPDAALLWNHQPTSEHLPDKIVLRFQAETEICQAARDNNIVSLSASMNALKKVRQRNLYTWPDIRFGR